MPSPFDSQNFNNFDFESVINGGTVAEPFKNLDKALKENSDVQYNNASGLIMKPKNRNDLS